MFYDPYCDWCDKALTGRQRTYCSNACRQAERRADERTRSGIPPRTCDKCGEEGIDHANRYGGWCYDCTNTPARHRAEEARWEAACELEGCDSSAFWEGVGRARKYCSDSHRQKAYRQRKRAASLTASAA
ncbi:hypothetical protein ABT093_01290 [Kitasatospora sp. NPDC002551]|uniref:hypothetical protein n=1 Tax=Kitasatospora sp. NPDC002551 TaxID=3154539 RepID=UPI003327C7B1